MRMIEWKDSYSVGIKAFDEEHKRLFEILNQITALFEVEDPKKLIAESLKDLESYTKIHFKSEEDLFNKYAYYNTDEQIKEHRFFMAKIDEFRKKYNASDMNVKLDMLEFLADWIMAHTQGIDKDYRNFFHNRGIF